MDEIRAASRILAEKVIENVSLEINLVKILSILEAYHLKFLPMNTITEAAIESAYQALSPRGKESIDALREHRAKYPTGMAPTRDRS